MNENIDFEALRKQLSDDSYAGAFSGLGAMILDVPDIENASDDELLEIARREGISIPYNN